MIPGKARGVVCSIAVWIGKGGWSACPSTQECLIMGGGIHPQVFQVIVSVTFGILCYTHLIENYVHFATRAGNKSIR